MWGSLDGVCLLEEGLLDDDSIESGWSDRMGIRSSLKANRKVVVLGRCFVRVGCCVLQVVVVLECSRGIVRAYCEVLIS